MKGFGKGKGFSRAVGSFDKNSVRNTGKTKVMFRRPHSIQKSKKHA